MHCRVIFVRSTIRHVSISTIPSKCQHYVQFLSDMYTWPFFIFVDFLVRHTTYHVQWLVIHSYPTNRHATMSNHWSFTHTRLINPSNEYPKSNCMSNLCSIIFKVSWWGRFWLLGSCLNRGGTNWPQIGPSLDRQHRLVKNCCRCNERLLHTHYSRGFIRNFHGPAVV